MPKVSIVVPVWNEEKYLEKCLDSIKTQNFKDFEVIIVDDCSTDNTKRIIEEFVGKNKKFKNKKTPVNSGTGDALNLGFLDALGEYQTWVSGDSWVYPNFLECFVDALDKNPKAVLAYCDSLCFNQDKTYSVHKSIRFNKKKLWEDNYIGQNWMFREEAKKKAGDFCNITCEDYYMHLMLAEQGSFIYVPKNLGCWRNHPKNLTNTISIPENWPQMNSVRALVKWKIANYKVAYISPTYFKEGWKFIDMINRKSQNIAIRHISNKNRHDLMIGKNDKEIEEVLKSCDAVHVYGFLPEQYKKFIHCPIIKTTWSNNLNDITFYEELYTKHIEFPKVSIVIPVYNEELYLYECLNSIKNQLYSDFEVIIVDDCSTDKSNQIIDFFKKIDPRFKSYKTEKNSGTATALNIGFKHAKGFYQTWIAGDNWVTNDFLLSLTIALDLNPDVVMAYADVFSVDEDNKNKKIIRSHDFNKKEIQSSICITCIWLFRANAKRKAGDYCDNICEDYYMHLMLLEQGKFLHVKEVLGCWRNHEKNLTNTVTTVQGNRPIAVARALARWNCTKTKIAFISPKNQNWHYMDSINKFSDSYSMRYICYDETYDLMIGKDDYEIENILLECDLVHCDDEMPEGLMKKIKAPIIYGNWTKSHKSLSEYEKAYKEKLNETIRKQQGKSTPIATVTASRKNSAISSSRSVNNIRLL
jgi:glycosyltransferase involved in cell wall biosynthesis